ncbi:MAG: DNA repair protein RecO [Desulfobacterota bacterium]|nr:DNA repair protein RecO [Thermodesulfobacteriota bacterium]MDW8001129.1 DNA repair protein RecO [Deltaproteobacteria bacterium]
MGLVKDEAIVTRKLSYGESDRIVHLFTLNSGKISAIAKGGAKSVKRFMNTLEPMQIINVEYFDKSFKGHLSRIESAHIVEDMSGIERDFQRFSLASFFIEVADRLTKERQPFPTLFHLLSGILRRLKTSSVPLPEVLMLLLKILETIGFLPNFKSCVHCGKTVEQKIYFSSEKGGILCERCTQFCPSEVYPDQLLNFLATGKKELSDQLISFAFDLLESFIKFHLDVELRTFKFIKPKDGSLGIGLK